MKSLPIGVQEFSKLRQGNYIYVDKTKLLFELMEHTYYFLSRPRRFGKSLLVNTIKEIFKGNKELFKGLWIYDKIEWKEYPIIKISFSNIDYKSLGLTKAINVMLDDIASSYNLVLESDSPALKFKELIVELSQKGKVIVLIDEYDKPIIDYIEQAEKNREILKNFYSIVKDSDTYLRFFFMTGVSKFSKVSFFSDLNNLTDITIDDNYSTMLGWTEAEVNKYFSSYLEQVQKRYAKVYPDIMPVIKEWYNGYSWDGENFVYNPVSLMNLFQKLRFGNYWFSTGTPSFLTKFIKTENYTVFDYEKAIDNKEKYFHSLFYMIMTLTGFKIKTEILTIDGRIDAVVMTTEHIFIIEFKINQDAKKAIEQIKEKNYAQKYANDERPVSLIGLNYNTDNKRIDDYLINDV